MTPQTPLKPLTNQSINSAAAVAIEIQSQEQIHWFWGLRSAELFIDQKQTALNQCYFNEREYKRQIRAEGRKRDAMCGKVDHDEWNDVVEAVEDKIAQHTYELQRLEWQIRDAVMELKVAIGERDRILKDHPEAMDFSYEQLQAIYTPVAMSERQAWYVAARIWAAQNGLPEAVGVAIFGVPTEQRATLMARETQIRTGANVAGALTNAGQVLSNLSEEQQEQVLLRAAQEIYAQQGE